MWEDREKRLSSKGGGGGGGALPAQPAVTLHAAREAATLVARFMAENVREFGRKVKFNFQRKIAAPMNRMMIGRLRC
jgi:hypothetical protein